MAGKELASSNGLNRAEKLWNENPPTERILEDILHGRSIDDMTWEEFEKFEIAMDAAQAVSVYRLREEFPPARGEDLMRQVNI